MIAPDDAQGAAVALLAKQLGVRRMLLLDDKEPYGLSLAASFTRAARLLGIHVVGPAVWDPTASSFPQVADAVAHAGATGVFLAGFECPHCNNLIRTVRNALGPHGVIAVPDGFSLSDMLASAGEAANGLYGSLLALPSSRLGARGREIALKFGPGAPDSGGPPYGAEAAEVLLGAIASSNGTRASVNTQLLGRAVRGGILGSFRFDRNGDIDPAGVSIDRVVRGQVRPDRAILVPSRLVHG